MTPPTTDSDASHSAPGELFSRVERRAELLALQRAGTPDHSLVDELESLTAHLNRALSESPTNIRRLSPTDDEDLLIRLVAVEPVHPLDLPDLVEGDSTADAGQAADGRGGTANAVEMIASTPGLLSAVHQRSSGDRYCFALESQALGEHPMNVVWVAICEDLPRGMGQILRPDRPQANLDSAGYAVYYSIWNAQPGLAGIPGGSELLKMAAASLQAAHPSIHTHTTISPVPGFRKWVETGKGRPVSTVIATEASLLQECARYLCSTDADGRPTDPVARFHMRNGARMWRLIPNADSSSRGWDRSWGVMVNYRYAPEDTDSNAQRFREGELVLDDQVRSLL